MSYGASKEEGEMVKRHGVTVALVLVATLLLALTVTGCGTSSSSTSGSASSGGTPKKGGTLVVTFQGEPTGLDPAIAWEVESWSMEHMLYNTFLKYSSGAGDAGTKLVPDLATAMPEVKNGGKTYIFHIRPDAKFAPPVNRPVTAEDFKYSFERMLKLPLAPATFFYSGVVGAQAYMDGKTKDVAGYKVIDPHTVEIDLTAADPAFLNAISMPFCYVVPKEWVDKWGNKAFARHPLGSGPFMFDHWTPGQEIVMKRNPNYFDQDHVYADEYDFHLSATPATALLQLERGEADILGDGVPPADFVRTMNDPKWKQYVDNAPQIAFAYTFMNQLEKPFDNVKVRQAICYAIDRTKIVKLLGGQASVIDQIYPVGMPGHQDGTNFYPYDPAKAKQLLAEAGYPNGFSTTYYADNVDPVPKIAQSIQNDLQAIGIKCSLKVMDRATYWNFISLKKSHAAIGFSDWYQDFPDPSDWIGPLFIKSSAIDGGANSSFWWDPRVDQLYKQATTELDATKRLAMFQQMQDIIMQEAPVDPMYQPVFNAMFGPNVGGFYVHPVWTFNFVDYWKK